MALNMMIEESAERKMARKTGLPLECCQTFLRLKQNREQMEFGDRRAVEKAIDECLLTPRQKAWMQEQEMSLKDIVIGFYVQLERESVEEIFKEWNGLIGFEFFKMV
jgi:hypothetical protein